MVDCYILLTDRMDTQHPLALYVPQYVPSRRLTTKIVGRPMEIHTPLLNGDKDLGIPL